MGVWQRQSLRRSLRRGRNSQRSAVGGRFVVPVAPGGCEVVESVALAGGEFGGVGGRVLVVQARGPTVLPKMWRHALTQRRPRRSPGSAAAAANETSTTSSARC